jgi:adenosylcobinamide-GDP ribazoletransferase
MNVFKGFIISFSMYSIIPMPRLEWDDKNMKYIFVFFPWIGLLIGFAAFGWLSFSAGKDVSSLLKAVILVLIPLVLSGGIHMDGFIDTCDAAFSYGDREKRLEILKDPRTGAFGVIGCGVYLLLFLGIMSQLVQRPGHVILLPAVFFISRSLGAALLLTVKKAKNTGLGNTFSKGSSGKINLTVLTVYLAGAFAFAYTVAPLLSAMLFAALILYSAWYVVSISRSFGGITGDLTGFFICTAELLLLTVIAVGG